LLKIKEKGSKNLLYNHQYDFQLGWNAYFVVPAIKDVPSKHKQLQNLLLCTQPLVESTGELDQAWIAKPHDQGDMAQQYTNQLAKRGVDQDEQINKIFGWPEIVCPVALSDLACKEEY
jgi:hypothetical protein